MQPDPKPVVYCETNWIVAMAFPHHANHRMARDLWEHAKADECEIRMPYASLLEASYAIDKETKQFQKMTEAVKTGLFNTSENGYPELHAIYEALGNESLKSYMQRPAPTILKDIQSEASVRLLHDQTMIHSAMDELRSKLRFRGKDVVDLYIIAAVISDRASVDPACPAIMFSTNTAEFEPKDDPKAKIPKNFFDPYQIAYRNDFDLISAVHAWRSKFSKNKAAPAASGSGSGG